MVVNARSSPRTDWDRRESPPGTIGQLLQASGVPIERYSFETVETMKEAASLFLVSVSACLPRLKKKHRLPWILSWYRARTLRNSISSIVMARFAPK